jgi:WD40 repeat protein
VGKVVDRYDQQLLVSNAANQAYDDKTTRGVLKQTVEASSPNLKTLLVGHTGCVYSAEFSSDGKTLASTSQDQTIRLWNASDNQLIRTFEGHTSWVLSTVFSPDGKTLASASNDHTIRLWDTNLEAKPEGDSLESWRARACSIVGRNLTQAEWKEFFGNLQYQTSCPEFPAGQ